MEENELLRVGTAREEEVGFSIELGNRADSRRGGVADLRGGIIRLDESAVGVLVGFLSSATG